MKSKEEAKEYVQTKIESSVILDILRDHVSKIVRVHQFLLTIVLRRRFKRKVKAIAKLQGFLRICLAKKRVKQRSTEIKEKERRRRMEIFTKVHKDQAKLNAAASLIQEKICNRLKRQREGRELR